MKTKMIQVHPLRYALRYLEEVIRLRLQDYFPQGEEQIIDPTLTKGPFLTGGHLKSFLNKHPLSYEELIALLMALAPHIQPHFYDKIILDYLPNAGDFPQLGGRRWKQKMGLLPNSYTVKFIQTGEDKDHRYTLQKLY